MSRFATPFGFHSTATEVIAGVDLTGKRAVVTGGAAGIGVETARALATAGATVTVAVRRPDAAESVATELRQSTGNRTFDVPKDAVVLDQRGCQYHPHVLGVIAGQTVEIRNDDPTTHNIHPTPKDNREWNESQPPSSPALQKTFAREEIMLPVKCNQHPWMKMYINVVKSPFFAVTDKDGKYEIKGLPPGDYTLEFVHEKLGPPQDVKVTLAPKDTKTADATFKAAGM